MDIETVDREDEDIDIELTSDDPESEATSQTAIKCPEADVKAPKQVK